jgi:hypothetical protein
MRRKMGSPLFEEDLGKIEHVRMGIQILTPAEVPRWII